VILIFDASRLIYERILMKTYLAFFLAALFSGVCFAQASNNWNNSPNNWQNSPNNWQNSSNNWQNSPNNWQNSANNWNSNNGVYDNSGNRIGYETQAPSGVTNVFDNNGNRIGYAPAKQ
jgi:hypothetical protein